MGHYTNSVASCICTIKLYKHEHALYIINIMKDYIVLIMVTAIIIIMIAGMWDVLWLLYYCLQSNHNKGCLPRYIQVQVVNTYVVHYYRSLVIDIYATIATFDLVVW